MIIENKEMGIRFEVDNQQDFDKWYAIRKEQIKADAIYEYKNKLWEDIETRYKNDIKILGYLSAENLLRDVHNAICYFAEQLKERKNEI